MWSARPFWVLFTICVIVLIQWLIVPRIVDGVITKEILSANMTVKETLALLDDTGGVNLDALPTNHSEMLTAEDLKHFHFTAKWAIIYEQQPASAVGYIAGLFAAGILAGFLVASVAFRHLVRFGDKFSEMSGTDKIALFFGFVIGLLISSILVLPITTLFGAQGNHVVSFVVAVIIVYLCVAAMMSLKDELKYYFPSLSRNSSLEKDYQKPKILDTNVIIDGRISDICRSGFIEGQVIIPSFILEELQHIADSSDSLRRARGRRGLDILNQMRKELNLSINQSEPVNSDNQEEVDMRLVNLAKEIDGYIITNDFNLNKVAEIHGVTVLNINELANALKPVALPGEEMTVSIVKEGKEMHQGIAYLDDGTMVVVENGKRQMGHTVDVTVTSVLQTVAGKMIFTNLKTVQEKEDDLIGRNVRSYSGLGPRKKTK